LSLLHGLAKITAAPAFWFYFVIPGIVYTIDKIVTLRTRYIALDILETELLPSDVLKVKFYRPPNMKVLSGKILSPSFREMYKNLFYYQVSGYVSVALHYNLKSFTHLP